MKSTHLLLTVLSMTCMFDLVHAEIEFERIGNPSWEPADAFISAVDFRNSQDFSEKFDVDAVEFLSDALGDSYVAADDELYILFPTDPTDATENRPFRDAIAKAGGYNSDVFLASDMLNSDRIFRGLTIVPLREEGEQRPTNSIPKDVFPIVSSWKHEFLNGDDIIDECQLCEPVVIDALDMYGAIIDENGESRDYRDQEWSEIPAWWTMAWSGSPSSSRVSGDYEGVIEYRDAKGDGWDVTYFYSVVPRRTQVDGDIDYDGELSLRDLDVLNQNVVLGSTNDRLDLNDDDAVDVSDLHFLVKDLMNTWVGDANLDGEFNSGDFVDVFKAGKYESGDVASWSEGDWNGDELFDSGDFIVAFQDGGYELGARAAVAAVPEPSSLPMLTLGILGIGRIRGR